MATESSFFLAEEELSCPICFEEFSLYDVNRHPKLLLCLHTFCSECMETLRKYDGTLQCSICRTSHNVYRIKDLMDNYVIFEHLKIKQETEDEKLARQLREEYDVSLRLLEEQEERDAAIAREEEEKNRIELERLQEEARKRKEEEQRRLEEERRRQEEERIRVEEEERKRRALENGALIEENGRKRSERAEDNIYFSDGEEREGQVAYSSTESSSSTPESNNDSGDSHGSSDTEEECPFQDVDEGHTEDEETAMEGGGENMCSRSTSSVNSDEDYDCYITLDDDVENHIADTISVSSGDEDDTGTAPSATAPVNSDNTINLTDCSLASLPDPNLLSDEFSGVAESKVAKPPESLSALLPTVVCKERSDGSIIVVDDHPPEAAACNDMPPSFRKFSQGISNINGYKKSVKKLHNEPVINGRDDVDWIDVATSSEDEVQTSRKAAVSDNIDDTDWTDVTTSSEDEALPYGPQQTSRAVVERSKASAMPFVPHEEENCKIQ